MADYVDQTIECRDCPESFVWTAGEQAFYVKNNFMAPTRCPACRAKRKAARLGQEAQGIIGDRQPLPDRSNKTDFRR